MGKVLKFLKECGAELRKVVWPSRDNVVASVKVVIFSSFIIAVVLGGLDLLFTAGMKLVF
jgi:preprotein translocase subunit SecE